MTEEYQNSLMQILRNPVFLAPLCSWFFAQFLKAIIEVARQRAKSSREAAVVFLWRTGGMPSSHSAAVAGLITSIGFLEGVDTTLFIVTLFFGLIVIRDALGVRRASGLQAKSLNKLGEELKKTAGLNFIPVKEVNGHSPAEVTVGILLGFFIGLAFFYL